MKERVGDEKLIIISVAVRGINALLSVAAVAGTSAYFPDRGCMHLHGISTGPKVWCLADFTGRIFDLDSMKHMERSVNDGLVALAASDLFLCLLYFVGSLYWNKRNFDSIPELYYRTHEELFVNFFLLARYERSRTASLINC